MCCKAGDTWSLIQEPHLQRNFAFSAGECCVLQISLRYEHSRWVVQAVHMGHMTQFSHTNTSGFKENVRRIESRLSPQPLFTHALQGRRLSAGDTVTQTINQSNFIYRAFFRQLCSSKCLKYKKIQKNTRKIQEKYKKYSRGPPEKGKTWCKKCSGNRCFVDSLLRMKYVGFLLYFLLISILHILDFLLQEQMWIFVFSYAAPPEHLWNISRLW